LKVVTILLKKYVSSIFRVEVSRIGMWLFYARKMKRLRVPRRTIIQSQEIGGRNPDPHSLFAWTKTLSSPPFPGFDRPIVLRVNKYLSLPKCKISAC
jgi:hypothetical protein